MPLSARPPGAGSLRLALAQLLLTAAAMTGILVSLVPQVEKRWLLVAFPCVGLGYVAAGVLAWDRRPSNRTGVLLCLGGLALMAAAGANCMNATLVTIGIITAELPIGVALHVLLAFPSGRLRDPRGRALAIGGYVVTVGLQAPHYLFSGDPSLPGWLTIANRPDWVDTGEHLQSWAGTVVVVLSALLLASRLRHADAAHRRTLAALYSYGVFAILFLVVSANIVQPLLHLDPYTLFELQLAVIAGIPIAFVTGVLRGGFARTGEIEELGTWLGTTEGARPELREALAATLGDPTLELLFWLDQEDRYVDASGRGAGPPATGVVEAELAGRRIGAIVYDEALIADPELVRAAGRVVAVALDRERLTVELRAHREALSESRARIVEAGDNERRRIARDLHDGLQGRLVVLAMRAGELAADPAAPPAVAEELSALRDAITAAIDELRRLVHGVLPALLLERGLYAATEELVDRMPIRTGLSLPTEDRRLPAAVETAGYFLIAEALANTLKHAQAHELSVALECPDGSLRIEVRDDGVGGAEAAKGDGLWGISDRIDVLGGRLLVDSPGGVGTRIRAEFPCVS